MAIARPTPMAIHDSLSVLRDTVHPGVPPFGGVFPLFQYGGVRYRRTASAADRAVLVELRRFLAVNHATGTLPGRRLARRRDGSLPAQE